MKMEKQQSSSVVRSLMILALTMSVATGFAQQESTSRSANLDEPPVDGYFVKSDVLDRKVIEYAPIRSADVAYVKRVWQEIDLRDKVNATYASPKSNLMEILLQAVMAGELTAYDPTPSAEDPTGDSFKSILPVDQVMGRFGGDSTLVEQYDEEGNVVSSHFEAADFNPAQVIRFRIKEDWIFDKQRSIFEPRIVGIAPLVTPPTQGMNASGSGMDEFGIPPMDAERTEPTMEVEGYPAFWIYFPEARYILVNQEVASRDNDAGNLSFDDVFVRRLFSSYVVKESNPEDLRIRDYVADRVDRLYEAERIKKSLIDFEQDLWSY